MKYFTESTQAVNFMEMVWCGNYEEITWAGHLVEMSLNVSHQSLWQYVEPRRFCILFTDNLRIQRNYK